MRKVVLGFGIAVLLLAPALFGAEPMTFRASGSAHGGQAPPAAVPEGGTYFLLDDGTYENSIGLTNQVTNNAAVWINRFTPAEFPQAIDYVEIMWPDLESAGRNLVGDPVTILVYSDTDGDGNPDNATLVYQETFTIGIQDGASFETYDLAGDPPCAGPGDIYIGFRDDFNLGGATSANFPAAIDTTAPQGRSWVGGLGPGGIDPDIVNLANNSLRGYIDDFGFPGNWMIRAAATVPQVVPVQAIPTLQVTGLAALVVALAAMAFWMLRRRRA